MVIGRNIFDGSVVVSWELPFVDFSIDKPLCNYDTYSDMLYMIGRNPKSGIQNLELMSLDPFSGDFLTIAILSKLISEIVHPKL